MLCPMMVAAKRPQISPSRPPAVLRGDRVVEIGAAGGTAAARCSTGAIPAAGMPGQSSIWPAPCGGAELASRRRGGWCGPRLAVAGRRGVGANSGRAGVDLTGLVVANGEFPRATTLLLGNLANDVGDDRAVTIEVARVFVQPRQSGKRCD